MFADLAEAVFAGDLTKAEGVLNFMHASGDRSDQIRAAKYRARPEARPGGAGPVTPIPLPQPGRTSEQVFGAGYSNPSGRYVPGEFGAPEGRTRRG